MTFFYSLKSAIFSMLFFLIAFSGLSQGLYIKLSGQYKKGVGYKATSEYATTILGGENFVVNYKQVNINYGRGKNFEGGAGYMFTKNIGAEINVSYLSSAKIATENSQYYPDFLVTYWNNYETYAKSVIINPAVVISAGRPVISPYGRVGLLLADVTIYSSDKRTLWTDKIEKETEQTGGWNFGFQTGAGVDFIANTHITFFSELTFNFLNFTPEKQSVTKFTENGTDVSSKLTVSDREIEYVENVSENYNQKGEYMPDKNQPTKRLKEQIPMSSIGVGLGIRYNF